MLYRTLVHVKRTEGLLSCGQMGINKNQSSPFCCSIKDYFLFHLQIKDKLHCLESVIMHRCPLGREHKQKKNPIFPFKSVCESVILKYICLIYLSIDFITPSFSSPPPPPPKKKRDCYLLTGKYWWETRGYRLK